MLAISSLQHICEAAFYLQCLHVRPVHICGFASNVSPCTSSPPGCSEGISGYTFGPRSFRDGRSDDNVNCDKDGSDNIITVLLY